MKDMKLGKLFATVVVVVIGIWFALAIVIPLVTTVLSLVVPLALLAFVGWVVWKILNYDPDKATG